ncbi:MAG: bifunctional homocysteine S-methyltransferase/methylenetetrahydrofolate reductase, partial [Myxococcales bacterium]|nr:bifunctional homocysteine S-methyltransferase/methylenetetrahydrofolate reductase [Myxococcales bacterium]
MRAFRQMAQDGGLLFDGAMGTMLYERGVFLTRCFEHVNLEQPALVRRVHEEYLQAGAHVLTTNTFGANRLKLDKHGLGPQVAAINLEGVKLAREVAGGRALVAGSVGPTGLGIRELAGAGGERAEEALAEQIDLLIGAPVDVLIFETFDLVQELELAVRLARDRTDLPIVALMMFNPEGKTRTGLTPLQAGRRIAATGADVIGANCGGGPDLLFRVTTPMVELGLPVMAMANAGRPENVEGRTIYVANPEYFGVFARRLLKAGVKVLGGCCGTNADHIRRMANATRMVAPDAPHSDAIEITRHPTDRVVPLAERSELGARLAAGEFVTSVEINPPNGFDLDRPLKAARALRDFGVTTINIADGPRASVRMSNTAFGAQLMQREGTEVIIHVCCRDRNLLGLQSHLLGMHVFGLRNLVIITGDPPKMGPYPHATAVYDVDSIGLLNIATGFNHGIDPSGRRMEEPTRFVCATGVEPGALDYQRELRRLEMKRDAGAQVVMTQPVYDPYKVERFLDDVAGFGLPVMLGLCPLASLRNALFLHENVPGMQVPTYILDRMAAADARGEGQAEGVRIAREALAAVRDRVQGAYIMPPFG